MATGTTNPMTYQNGSTTVADHTHSVDEITGLASQLDKIQATESLLGQVERLLATCDNLLSASGYATKEEVILIEQYTADIQNIQAQLDSILKEDVEDGFNSLKENQVTLQAAVAELQTKINTAYDAANAVMELYKVAEGNTAGELQKLNEAIVEIKKIIDGDGTEEFPGLIPNDTINAEKLATLDERLVTAEADILNLKGADTEQASLLVQLDTVVKQYLPSEENGEGEIKQTTNLLQSTIPTELVISRADAVEEPAAPASEEPSGEDPAEEINTDTYLDYTLTFNNSEGEQKFSANLDLTSDINSYLAHVFAQFVSQHTTFTPTEAGLNSRLAFVEGRLSNLTQYVAHMANYHNFIIKDIYFYFANDVDGTDPTALKYLPAPIDPTPEENLDIQADFVNIIPAFSNTARMDDKVFSPSELKGKNFYIIFETSYPIDLGSDKVSLGFPDFQENNTRYTAPSNFKCARLGIPDLSHATYVLYADINDETKKLTPFTFGSGTFGSNFTEEGTYEFMLKVTDPYNPNMTALKTKQITIGYPIYRGIYMETTLPVEGLSLDTFSLQHTELNSPATTIDWSDYNVDDIAKYYYYLVPSILLPTGSTLVFNTGYGPGGWETQDYQIKINNIDYTVFRTSYKLTYCPSTRVTVKSI